MNKEIWKPIIIEMNGVLYDYTGLYEVSNLGNVRSLNYMRTGKVKVLKAQKNKGGYLMVCLTKKTFYVHRLVATAFLDNPKKLQVVNHKDENKENNNVKNLEWCTQEYNSQYSNCGRLHTEEECKKISEASKGRMSSKRRKVLCIETQQIFESVLDASEWCGSADSNLIACLKGRKKTCKRYHWKYID